jgi:hypothetical protein
MRLEGARKCLGLPCLKGRELRRKEVEESQEDGNDDEDEEKEAAAAGEEGDAVLEKEWMLVEAMGCYP